MAIARQTLANYGGEGGIRTLETLTRLLVFKTSAFNHSATSPVGPDHTKIRPVCQLFSQ